MTICAVCSCSPERHWWLKLQDDITSLSQWWSCTRQLSKNGNVKNIGDHRNKNNFYWCFFLLTVQSSEPTPWMISPRPHDLTPSNYSNNPIVAVPQTWDHTDTHVEINPRCQLSVLARIVFCSTKTNKVKINVAEIMAEKTFVHNCESMHPVANTSWSALSYWTTWDWDQRGADLIRSSKIIVLTTHTWVFAQIIQNCVVYGFISFKCCPYLY